jgi:hypothetical protein
MESYVAAEMNWKLTPVGLCGFEDSAGIVEGEEVGLSWGDKKLVVVAHMDHTVCRSVVVGVH